MEPEVPPEGTGATTWVAVQLCGVAVCPLKVTLLEPCEEPNPLPLMVTTVPTAPEVGDTLLMPGAELTVKVTPLLARPLAVTTTLPVVAPEGTGTSILVDVQLRGVAAVPLNLTVLEPWVEPKFVPVIVTAVAMPPEVGDKLEIAGATSTVKVTPLLGTPLTVTTTGPLVAPVGTGTTIFAAAQLVGVPLVPLKVTVLVPCVEPKFVPVTVTD